MKKVTKRILSAMLSAFMLLTMLSAGAVFASEDAAVEEVVSDWVIADFSQEGTREKITEWQGDDGYAFNTGARPHKMSEITNEVSLDGGTTFKIDHRYGKTKADGTMGVYNTRLLSKDFSGEEGNLGKALQYNYLYALSIRILQKAVFRDRQQTLGMRFSSAAAGVSIQRLTLFYT